MKSFKGLDITDDEYSLMEKHIVPYLYDYICTMNVIYQKELVFNQIDILNYISLHKGVTDYYKTIYATNIVYYSESQLIDMVVCVFVDCLRNRKFNISFIPYIYNISKYYCLTKFGSNNDMSKFVEDNAGNIDTLTTCISNSGFPILNDVITNLHIDTEMRIEVLLPIVWVFSLFGSFPYTEGSYTNLTLYSSLRDSMLGNGIKFGLDIKSMNVDEAIRFLLSTKQDDSYLGVKRIAALQSFVNLDGSYMILKCHVAESVLKDLNKARNVEAYNKLVLKYEAKYERKIPFSIYIAFECYKEFVIRKTDSLPLYIANAVEPEISELSELIHECAPYAKEVNDSYLYGIKLSKINSDRILLISKGAETFAVEMPHIIDSIKVNTISMSVDIHINLSSDLIECMQRLIRDWVTGSCNIRYGDNISILFTLYLLNEKGYYECTDVFKFISNVNRITGYSISLHSTLIGKRNTKFFKNYGDYGSYLNIRDYVDLEDKDRLQLLYDKVEEYKTITNKIGSDNIAELYYRKRANILKSIFKLKNNAISIGAFFMGAIIEEGAVAILCGCVIMLVLFVIVDNLNFSRLCNKLYKIQNKFSKR